MNPRTGVFPLGDLTLLSGLVLPAAQLSWKSFGELAPDRGNAILYPTSYGAQHTDVEWLVKPDGILDPRRWFVVIVDMFGNGLSTSPSHLADPAPAFTISHADTVRAQERLLREHFGIERLALVYGWSLGAQQAYHWGALFPERVARIAALCGTARTSEHNRLFLMSPRGGAARRPGLGRGAFHRGPGARLARLRAHLRLAGRRRRSSTAARSIAARATPTSRTTWRARGSRSTAAATPCDHLAHAAHMDARRCRGQRGATAGTRAAPCSRSARAPW